MAAYLPGGGGGAAAAAEAGLLADDDPLLSGDDGGLAPKFAGGRRGRAPVQDTAWWRAVHAAGFATGGLTFIAGTALYWLPPTDAIDALAAALYTLGSVGFLTVDVMEFFTPAFRGCPLRANIAMSAVGSSFYVGGSVGYFPSLLAAAPAVGPWGFVVGSAAIAASQTWKVARLSQDPGGGYSLRHVLRSRDVGTAVGVEFGACVGAALFLVGTAGQLAGWDAAPVLWTWLAGSVAFTAGAAFLAWRHFVMGVS